mgnify:CR=1 FL=1
MVIEMIQEEVIVIMVVPSDTVKMIYMSLLMMKI